MRIRNGEVCYWPNLGYGHFGAKVTMDNAPRFDSLDQFDQRRIRLADTDGWERPTSCTCGVMACGISFNQSRQSLECGGHPAEFPPVDTISSVQALDLLGNGTACLVWSSSLPGDARRAMRYLELMEEKPHFLVKMTNNLGAKRACRRHPPSSTWTTSRWQTLDHSVAVPRACGRTGRDA